MSAPNKRYLLLLLYNTAPRVTAKAAYWYEVMWYKIQSRCKNEAQRLLQDGPLQPATKSAMPSQAYLTNQ
jgi:hypothetical protein